MEIVENIVQPINRVQPVNRETTENYNDDLLYLESSDHPSL